MRVEGVVRFRDLPAGPLEATVRVRLLDTSRADAAAETMAEETIERVLLARGDLPGEVGFALEALELPPGRVYTLAAHVDVSGNGEVEAGDYITMESVPFEPAAAMQVEVPVRRVSS